MSEFRRRKSVLGLSVVLAVALTGCSDNTDRPPSLRYGEEACDHCRMLINDDRFAVAVATEDGAIRKFDDISCYLAYQDKHRGPVKRCWVCDYRSAHWLDAREAFFVCSPRIESPMGGGVAAVDNLAEARALADRLHGRVVRLDELPAALESPPLQSDSQVKPSK